MHHLDDEAIYFKCPNCPTTYNFKEFQKLDHKSHADPSEGANVLGHATCRNCSKDFYYYFTSEAYPIVVEDEPPVEVILGSLDQTGAAEKLPPPALVLKPEGKAREHLKGNEPDRMAQFEQAISKIDKELPPSQLAQKMSDSLDIIVTESRPQIEAAFDLLRKRFGLNARKIEAFRHEVKIRRDQLETDNKMKDINAIFANLSKEPKEMEEEEKAKALAYLQDPNLFHNISKDIAIAGEVVGEETNKMMLYLAATSRKFKKPISLVVFGKSSSGKSYLANSIAQFMPQEDTLVLSSLSAKALEYSNGKLKHKCILIQEWEGAAETLPTLRVLLSEGKLSRYVPRIDPVTKKHVSVADEQEGPCSLIITTTKEHIHDENSTRIFELYVEENLEKIRKVVRATLNKGDMTKRMSLEAKKQILDLHHNAQRLLETVEVNIPFAEHLSFPAKTSRHQRDSERFLNLIRAVAFLRQKQKGEIKTVNGERCIDAELADYKIAYEIGRDVIRATLNTISDRAKNALIVCCELNDKYLAANKDPWFSVTEIQETAAKLGLDFSNRPDLYKQLDKLQEYEYLEGTQARKNAMRHYKVRFAYQRNEAGEISNIDLPDIKEILTPVQLEEKIRNGPSGTSRTAERTILTAKHIKHHFTYEGQTGIAVSKEFQKKQLADLACNIGNVCEFGCTFCYVPAVTTKQKYVQEVLKKGFSLDEVSLYRTKDNLLKCVERDLKKHKKGDGDERVVFFCTTCDPCPTEEYASITIEAIKLIMENSELHVRVLSKSKLIVELAKALDPWRERIIYGLSTGTYRPEISACIEGNATPVEERIKALRSLQAISCRTYGMLCPILPSEMDYLGHLIDAINPEECEHIWAEPINLRGKSLVKTYDQLKQCGLEKDAEELNAVMGNKERWRSYSKELFTTLRHELEKRKVADKLRFLQYVKGEPEEFGQFFESQKGALCL